MRNFTHSRELTWLNLWLCGAIICLAHFKSAAADRHWDGNGGNTFWGTAGNWSNNIAPVAGDNLFFPADQLVPSTTTNNFAPGTAFGKITIAATSFQYYILGGNRVTLNNGLAFTANQFASAPLVAFDLTLGADQLFTSTRGITIGGRVDLNGRFLTLSPSSTANILFSGTVANSPGPGAYVTKTNTGTLTLSSTARFEVPHYWESGGYDWPSIDVLNGTLRLDGAATNGNPVNPVKIRVWSPAVLTGTGIADVIEVFYGGGVSPGNNGPGVLRCNNIYPNNNAGRLQLDINGTTPATDYDQIVTGGYPGWSGVLDLRFGFVPQLGDTFFVMVPSEPIGNTFTPGGILDHTNGCSFGMATSSNGFSLATLRRPDSPFAVWKGSVTGTFPFIFYSSTFSPTNNWAGGIGPTNTGKLVFTEYGLGPLLPVTNDLASGYSLISLDFAGTNIGNYTYVLYGNALTITDGITNRIGVGSNTIMLDLVVSGSMVCDVGTASTLRIGKSFNGGGTVYKRGAGELRYTGTTFNSFVGDFVLNSGTFRVDGMLTDGGTTVIGGILSGTGTVASVTMTGGIINPGGSPGILNVEGNFSSSPGATCQFELNSPIAGSGYDQLRVNGGVSLNGATLHVQPGYAAPVGSVFLLVINDGSDAVVGTFAGLPQGAVFQAGGQHFSISYQSGSGGNDIVLTRVNAPPQPGQFSSVTRFNANTVQLHGTGGSNINYIIQANTNLNTTNWLDIGTAPSDNLGQFMFSDSNVLQFPTRFFRTKNP